MTSPVLSRRSVLRGAGLIAAGSSTLAVAGCHSSTSGASVATAPTVDQLAATRLYDQLTTLSPRPGAPDGAVQRAITTAHRTQLAALGTPVGPRTAASPAPFSEQAHVTQEAATAAAALTDVAHVSAPMAVLLTQVALSCGAAADALAAAYKVNAPGVIGAAQAAGGGSGSASASATSSRASSAQAAAGDSSPDRAALTKLVAAEHAVIYGYGVLTAWLPSNATARAQAAWALHRSRRERYAAWLRDLGGQVPVAAAAYDLRIDGKELFRSDPRQLAAVLERRMASNLLWALSQTDAATRTWLAQDAVGAGRRLHAWGGDTPALLDHP